MIFDKLLRQVGILPDTISTTERENDRLQEVHEADEKQRRQLRDAKRTLERSNPKDLTEREFMEEILRIERRRNGEES